MFLLKMGSRTVRGLFLGTVAAVIAAALVVLLSGPVPAIAEQTRFWRQSDYENFERGKTNGTALRSDGKISLAPKFATLADAGLAYLWAVRLDSRGNLYAAGGANAKVVRVEASGQTTAVFDSSELSAQTLLLDRRDNLYVGTSPDGKIYRVTPNGQQSVFFDPKMKYIWDMAMGADGTLYVATGDTGRIFSVSPDGRGDVFYASPETHIRALALDGKGNLLAGTEPSGLILRIPLASPSPATPRGPATQGATDAGAGNRQAFVLYETTRREITSLVLGPSGDLFVGAIGEKPRVPQPMPQPQQSQMQPQVTAGAVNAQAGPGRAGTTAAPVQQPQTQPTPFQPFPTVTSSAVYRIAPDGSPEELWASRDELVYSLGMGADGKLLLGTGNQGAVIQLDGNRVFSRLAKSNSRQITGLARAANGRVYVATANPGKIFTLGPELEAEGTFESQAFDARIFSRWGRLTWWGENGTAPASGVELYVRAGNTSDPENSWSGWSGPYRDARGEEAQAPAARFVQWKAVLRSGRGPAPEISWVSLAYLPKNMPPRIDAIAVQNPGVRVAAAGGGQGQGGGTGPVQLRQPMAPAQAGAIPARPQTDTATAPATPRFEPPPQGFAQKGHQAVLWAADDVNEDDLTYSIYFRGESETGWKLLRDKIAQRFYSWDTTSMPDGAYYLKIAASDERSNAPGEALSAERESERFVVDNTPPEVSGLTSEPVSAAGVTASGVTLRFRASDATSAIVNAQYSLDAGDWTLIPPADGVSDALEEAYAIVLRDLAPGEHTVAVRVYDQYDNLAAGKVTLTIAAPRR
jgi:hypothetical protein